MNFDAVVSPDALAELAAVADDPTVGIATASLRLDDRPDLMNSAGNEVHFLGYSWCGGLNEPASQHREARDVASASGAAMVMRRELWERLGGFAPEYFMYYEDPELSLRCWRAGLRVVFVPDAVVVHRYEFGRNPEKMYLVERNRLIAMFTLLEAPHPRAPPARDGRRRARDARAGRAAGLGSRQGPRLVVAAAPPSVDQGAPGPCSHRSAPCRDAAFAPLARHPALGPRAAWSFRASCDRSTRPWPSTGRSYVVPCERVPFTLRNSPLTPPPRAP